jgi:hypothetical protein
LIWWIPGGFRPLGAVATDIRADSTLIRLQDAGVFVNLHREVYKEVSVNRNTATETQTLK